jgi:shikimate dehydrogenase
MFPQVDIAPVIPYEAITNQHHLFDLIYNPSETLFLKKGIEKGATTQNGLEMLHIQAEESWKIWNAITPVQQ